MDKAQRAKIKKMIRPGAGGDNENITESLALGAEKENAAISNLMNAFKNKISEEKLTEIDKGSTLSNIYQTLMPENITQEFGKFFSNSVYPYGYTGKNDASGYAKNLGKQVIGIDKPDYGEDYNAADFPSDLPGREYLERSGFGIKEEDANRLGGSDMFLRLDKSNVILNPENKISSTIQEKLDAITKNDFLKRFNNENLSMKEHNSERTGLPVLAGINFEPQGEGQDEKGYYVKYSGKDPWDFATDGSNTGKGNSSLLKLIRSFVDANLTNKQTVNYEGKYYPKWIKKKEPEKKRVTGNKNTAIYQSAYD